MCCQLLRGLALLRFRECAARGAKMRSEFGAVHRNKLFAVTRHIES
jgi:hypothetical protein